MVRHDHKLTYSHTKRELNNILNLNSRLSAEEQNFP